MRSPVPEYVRCHGVLGHDSWGMPVRCLYQRGRQTSRGWLCESCEKRAEVEL